MMPPPVDRKLIISSPPSFDKVKNIELYLAPKAPPHKISLASGKNGPRKEMDII